uniref:UBX domain-containing protein n=1 Tax=Leersia perrieri TaxID=77586 RepID=A0A0D9XLM4_9ORYZ
MDRERDVVVSEDAAAAAAAASSSSFAETRVICRVCQKQFAQYTCPRCNARYCSLPCYKGHSVQCTESFMRENVMDELKQMQPEDESKKKMLDILKRFHLEEEEMDSEGEDVSILSEELIQKVMSGDEIKLEDLSEDEIKRFRQALASGELSKMIEPWTPWWKKPSARSIALSPDGSQLIRHVSVEDASISDPMADQESISEIPEGPESSLPSLKQLTRAEPSPLLAVHLVDILYCYCFTLRLYNGDWHSDPFGASTVAMSMSKVMGDDAKPETVSEALTACIEETCSPAYRHTGGFKFAIGLVDDIISLLSLGGNALVCALCDFRRLIHTSERMFKAEKLGKTERARSTQKLRGADRKLYFMTCWVHEQPNEAWPSLARLVEVQKASLEELNGSSQLHRDDRKKDAQSKLFPPPPAAAAAAARSEADLVARPPPPPQQQPGIAWKLVTLPFYVVSGGVGLIAGSIRLGAWVAGGVLSRSLSLIGFAQGGGGGDRLLELPPSAAEAVDFVAEFEREFGAGRGPRFVAEGFADALQRAQREYKLLFVYLHSPDHPDTPAFCGGSLCAEPVAAFIDENFVAWGGSIRRTEGFKMSNSLNASRFPFCAVVMASTNQRIVLLRQIEGPKSPEEMITTLQGAVEECSASLVAARIEAEERLNNQRLREEQDAAYRAALEADQARERQQREEQEKREREAAEAERKRKQEEEAQERAAQEAAEKEAALARRRQEKAMALGAEPERGPDVTRVLIRFPTGERKERRFHSNTTITSVYDYVDSLDCLKAEKYSLVSNFPRVTYGPEKFSQTLEEAGLHPQASLFIEIEQ